MRYKSAVLMAAFAAALSAQRGFEIEGRYWMPQMTSRVRVEAAGFGTDIDTKRDLGIPDTNFAQGQFTFQSAGRSRLRFTYSPIDFTGDNFASRTILYRGTQYTFGTRLASDVRVDHLQLSWAYQFSAADGKFKIGPMLEADGFLMKTTLRAPDLSPAMSENEALSAGLPTAGLALDIHPHRRVHIYGEASGMQAGGYGYFVGSDAGVKMRPWKGLFLTAGYRTFNLHITHTPDFARLDMRGPFAGAGWWF